MICIITFWRILLANFKTKGTFIFIVNSQKPWWYSCEGAEDFDPSVLLPAVYMEAESERHDWRQRRSPVQHPRFTRKPHLVFNWGKNKRNIIHQENNAVVCLFFNERSSYVVMFCLIKLYSNHWQKSRQILVESMICFSIGLPHNLAQNFKEILEVAKFICAWLCLSLTFTITYDLDIAY